jgi:N-acetylmuramoyl-L-alanine amidase
MSNPRLKHRLLGGHCARGLFVLLLLWILLLVVVPRAHAVVIDCWIDPGHGNADSGTQGIDGPGRPNEADITFHMCQTWLQDWLWGYGYDVALTRNSEGSNSFKLLPSQRKRILNGLSANDASPPLIATARFIISIHMNATAKSKKTGAQDTTFKQLNTYWNPNAGIGVMMGDIRSFVLGSYVSPRAQAQYELAFGYGCRGPTPGGLKLGNFFMIRDVNAPAILVEVCFISTRCQFNTILTDAAQSEVSQGIADGVTFYAPPGGVPDLSAGAMERLATLVGSMRGSGVPVEGPLRPAAVEEREAAASTSFSEDFDGTTFPPAGWSVQTSGAPAPHAWGRSTDTLVVRSGAGAAIVRGGYASPSDEWLVSPMLKVGSNDTGLAFYWAGNHDLAAAVDASCLIRRKSDVGWTTVWTLSGEPTATRFIYRDRVINLAPYLGDSIQFAFRAQGTNGPDFAVDDVSVGSFQPTGPPPNDDCATALSLPSGTFSLTGQTCYGANDVDPNPGATACVSDEMSGRDVVYRFFAQAGDSLDVTVSGGWNPAVYLLSACPGDSIHCLAGAYPIDGATPPSFAYLFDQSDQYFLVVDGPAGNCGSFSLTGSLRGTTTGVGPPWGPTGATGITACPNPTRGATHFSGKLPVGRETVGQLEVFDPTGRRVLSRAILVSGGGFEMMWDGRAEAGGRLPAGVYLIRASADGRWASARVVIVK